MLSELAVRDLGVFTEARLVLGSGFTALTGETGAGKSLVVGAIELLLGARADAGVVRPGATEAIVDGRFETPDGEEVVLSRVVPAQGRSRAYCNGRPVTVAELAERGGRLVELHGQHAHQQLLRAGPQRDALDRYAGIDLRALRAARAELARIDQALVQLGGDERTRARELDLLAFQLEELDSAGLDDPDEDEHLDAEESLLADATAHREAAGRAAELLAGDGQASELASRAIGEVTGRSPFDALDSRLRDLVAELDDVAAELRRAEDDIVDDPTRLGLIRVRRQLLSDLRRKYGDTLADVITERESIRARLDELVGHDARAEALAAERAAAAEVVAAEAATVATARRAAAAPLATGIESRLRALAMPSASMTVAVDGPDPADDVAFLLAANPGSPPAPVAKVASGGELSRAALALRLELTAGPPSLVFDEVDAGVGGEAAWSVGRSLAALAARHQILVVTHLAQVAAFADEQLAVHKAADQTEASTVASVEPLSPEGRMAELARMLSGQPDSEVGREHAAQLLADARSEGITAAGDSAG